MLLLTLFIGAKLSFLEAKILPIPDCFKTADGHCHEPLTQGPCQDGQWLVADDSGMLECLEKPCGPNRLLIGDRCRHLSDTSLCPSPYGEGLFANAKGEPSCKCWDGWIRRDLKKKKKTRDQSEEYGGCHQLFTQGFCLEDQIVSVSDDLTVCIDNPCGDSSENLPHHLTWISPENFTCHGIKKWPEKICDNCPTEMKPENLTNCEVVIDNEIQQLMCEPFYQLFSVLNTCLGKSCCKSGKIWSKHRERCIRNIFRGD